MQIGRDYSLRQVADLTGLIEFTLRGWEGRYRAFSPYQTDTSLRKYSKNDLKSAFLLRELFNSRQKMGDIARLSNSNLEKRLNFRILSTKSLLVQLNRNCKAIETYLKLVFVHDWSRLKINFQKVVQKKEPIALIENIILPILSGPRTFVVTTPDGDYHDLGRLAAHVRLSSKGINSLFIGPKAPKEDLCETAIRFGSRHASNFKLGRNRNFHCVNSLQEIPMLAKELLKQKTR